MAAWDKKYKNKPQSQLIYKAPHLEYIYIYGTVEA
jgi:hypothetical protein